MTVENQPDFGPGPRIPARLRDALRAADQPGFRVLPEVDEAIRAAARGHFRRRRRQRVLRLWGVGAAAAAVLLLAVYVRWPSGSESTARPGTVSPVVSATAPQAVPETVAHRRVNILDAFALARALKAGETARPEWDYNGDGVVDRADVDRIAMAAVRLEGGT